MEAIDPSLDASSEDDVVRQLAVDIRDGRDPTVAEDWAEAHRDDLEELNQEMDYLAGSSRGAARPGHGRLPRSLAEPSGDVKRIMTEAMHAYGKNDLDRALQMMHEVLRIDPLLQKPWLIICTIYSQKGELEKALRCELVAKHLQGKAVSADDWAALGVRMRDMNMISLAVQCFHEALRRSPMDAELLWEKAVLLKSIGRNAAAAQGFAKILEQHPHDPGSLREYYVILIEQGRAQEALDLYMGSFRYFISLPDSANVDDDLSSFCSYDMENLCDLLAMRGDQWRTIVNVIHQGMRWEQQRLAETQWDNFDDDREFDIDNGRAIDSVDNDGAAPEADEPCPLPAPLRVRLGVARLHLDQLDKAQHQFDIVREMHPLAAPLFGLIADALFGKGLYVEAITYYSEQLSTITSPEYQDSEEPLLQPWHETCAHIYSRLGQAYLETNHADIAKDNFEHAVFHDPKNTAALIDLARVNEALGFNDKAVDILSQVLALTQRNPGSQLSTSSSSTTDHIHSSWVAPQDRPLLGRADFGAPGASSIGPTGHRQRVLDAQHQFHVQREQACLTALVQVDNAESRFAKAMNSAEFPTQDARNAKLREISLDYCQAGRVLIDAIASMRHLYRKEARVLAGHIRDRHRILDGAEEATFFTAFGMTLTRLSSASASGQPEDDNAAILENFGRPFRDWCLIIAKYALLAQQFVDTTGTQEAYNALQILMLTRFVRGDSHMRTVLRLVSISVLLHGGNYDEAFACFRILISSYRCQAEPVALFLAVVAHFDLSLIEFTNVAFSKFLHRECSYTERLVAENASLPVPQRPHFRHPSLRARPNEDADQNDSDESDSDDEERHDDISDDDDTNSDPTSPQPQHTGYMYNGAYVPVRVPPVFYLCNGFMFIGKLSHNIAARAFLKSYAQWPDHPLNSLALAVAYLQRAMNRTTDNRNAQIAHALAFLESYASKRRAESEIEALYNKARLFHSLTINDQAMFHYEAVLRLRHASADEATLQQFAAYNLMQLAMHTRNIPLASDIANNWLAV